MSDYGVTLFALAGYLTQFAAASCGLAVLIQAAVFRRSRWRMNWRSWRKRDVPAWLLKLWRTDRESKSLHARTIWLAGCGMRIDPRLYLAYRRMALFLLAMIAGTGIVLDKSGMGAARLIVPALAVAAGLVYFDGALLNAIRKYRTDIIRKELIAVASQLLYYAGSRLHLHNKLMKCVSLTRLIRPELIVMLNEWYHDPDQALRQFKEKLGTEEAYGFAENLRSLRLHESEEVYESLKALVREFKARVEWARESRKETTSYLLFVLAGIPILYTFQVFLYPWVQEAARLFDALNS
jgi:hypothetical protein